MVALVVRTLDDDADGKEIIDTFETTLLLLHLLPNGVDGFCAPLHVEFQSGLLETLLYRADETFNIGIARLFRSVQFVLDHVVGIMFKVFKREVFQLALQFV